MRENRLAFEQFRRYYANTIKSLKGVMVGKSEKWRRADGASAVAVYNILSMLQKAGAGISDLTGDLTVQQVLELGGDILKDDPLWDALPPIIGAPPKLRATSYVRDWLRSELDAVR